MHPFLSPLDAEAQAYYARLAAEAPPLSEETKTTLRRLLNPATRPGDPSSQVPSQRVA